MAENKEDKKEEVVEEETTEETVEETENVAEEVKEAEVVVEEENKAKNSKTLINIIAIVIIAVTFILGIFVVFQKPSPKRTAKSFFELSLKNPIEAAVKFAVNDFDLKVEKEKGKYVSYKINKVEDIEEKDGREIAKVHYTRKGPNTYKIVEEVERNLEERKVKKDTAKYNKEFLKELKTLLKEKKDQLEEEEDTLTLIRYKGERNWTITTSYF